MRHMSEHRRFVFPGFHTPTRIKERVRDSLGLRTLIVAASQLEASGSSPWLPIRRTRPITRCKLRWQGRSDTAVRDCKRDTPGANRWMTLAACKEEQVRRAQYLCSARRTHSTHVQRKVRQTST